MNRTAQTRHSDQSAFIQRSRSLLTAFTLLSAMPGLLNAAALASLDRDAIYAGDTATLRIIASGDDAGKQPDLTPLQNDFEVLGTTSSSQIRIVNGQRSDRYEWLIELAPVAKGNIQVPALTVGSSKTAALTLRVSEQPAPATAQAGAPVFMRSEINASQGDIYVQQQILYTTRLYYRVPLIEGSFTDPKTDDAVIQQLGEDKQYNTTIDGQSYQVLERSFAIFPEHSGKLTIAPTVFSGRAVSATGRRSSLGRMDSLIEQMLSRSGFNERFFGGTPFGDPGKRVRLASDTLTLDVKPRPDGYSGAHWLPTQKLVIQDSWTDSPPVIRAGEPVTRTLTLEAKGLEASQLPHLKLEGTDTLRVYPEQPELSNRTDGDWVYGRSEQRFTYVASQPGRIALPAVQVSWWDSVNHKQQNTVLPAWEVKVEAGSGTSAAPASASGAETAPARDATQPNSTATTAIALPTAANTVAGKRLYWQMGGGLGVGVLLLVAFLLIRRQRKPESADPQAAQHSANAAPQPAGTHDQESLRRSRQSLRDACAKSDPRAAAGALLDWAAATWPEQPPRSLVALAARVERGDEVIRELETALYGAKEQSWNGQALWKAFMNGLMRPGKQAAPGQPTDGAPPLYPDWREQAG
jgi:hypothetical protein